MNRSTAFLLAGLPALSVVGAPTARADIPLPATSHVDPCIVTCPAADSLFVLIARHADGRPYAFPDVTIDICGCPDVVLADVPTGGEPYWINGCQVRKFGTQAGVASFPLEAGGLCSGASIEIYCAGFLFGTRTHVASFDQDGDLVVTDFDLSQVSGKQGTNDLTADFDCDGDVDAADVAIAAGHAGHHHSSIVGVGDGRDVAFGVRAVPNPSRGPVEFILRAPTRARGELGVYDVTGRRIATVLDREVEPGLHHVPWLGRDDAGRPIPAGYYLYRLRLGERSTRGALVIAH